MTSIRTPVIRRSNIDGRGRDVDWWPDVNGRRWRVINRRWRSDVHRLRCERAADNSSDAESHQSCTTAEPLPALAEPVSESAAMPMAAAAMVTLYMVRILKTPL